MSQQAHLCKHLEAIKELKVAAERVCSECVRMHGQWVHLRTCQTCGQTLCCDSSPNRHMTAHYHATRHPVVISSEPGERWLWCYPDEVFQEY
jgi:Zn-finger in ubiquitin-hydrolases and other protein